jgi:hypothetical protein
MRLVTALLGLMLLYVIGANLLSPVNAATSVITTAAGYSAPVVSLSALLPLFFVVGLIMAGIKGLDFAM